MQRQNNGNEDRTIAKGRINNHNNARNMRFLHGNKRHKSPGFGASFIFKRARLE